MQREKIKVKEVIVVEGRDDTAAINQAVDGITIETHGFGIGKNTWDKLKKAYETKGLIVFTDPDFSGNEIRRKILEKFPNCKEAFLTKKEATKYRKQGEKKDSDIGIENAKPEDIIRALEKARCQKEECAETFTEKDLDEYGLTGKEDSKEKRELVGRKLGIGYSNGKNLLKKLNKYGITKEELEAAINIDKE